MADNQLFIPVLVFIAPCMPAQGYVATEQSARLARSSQIAEGVRKRPHRPTRAEKLRETDLKFGLIKR